MYPAQSNVKPYLPTDFHQMNYLGLEKELYVAGSRVQELKAKKLKLQLLNKLTLVITTKTNPWD